MSCRTIVVALLIVCAGSSGAQDSGSDYLSPALGTLRYVPGGSFSRDGNPSNVTVVSAFRIGSYEVTREQFERVLRVDPSNARRSSGESSPVQSVNWYHAIAFCNALSLLEGFELVYAIDGVDFERLPFGQIPAAHSRNWDAVTADWSADGYRLPTEFEWMWAAMGAQDAYAKPFAGAGAASGIDDYVWHLGNSGWKTWPIGSRLANEIGLHDMSGNVQEWCWDWYAPYPNGTLDDYRGARFGDYRVRRGGSAVDPSNYCTVRQRLTGGRPEYADAHIGFRVVRN